MIIKRAILEAFRGTISDDITIAKAFLTDIEKRSVKNEKAEIGTILTNLISMRYKGNGNIREYIMEMSHLASKLKILNLEISEDLIVYLVLISLPARRGRLKLDKTESAHLTFISKSKRKRPQKKEAVDKDSQKKQHEIRYL
ncbi:uncharacterized protein LOC130818680 [Amaranthus tricolor]|uniref:uncharacterized protein LOC130818680 n=1 Tax=Amaranthus tricolor TaxID=29722 RepID=UPI00258807C4|nr:uncharacterized protein LOC130818680 [Amaranthus tricolor]